MASSVSGPFTPADQASVNLPFDMTIEGVSPATALVEVRGENGLLLPATQNPKEATAGTVTIQNITSLTGTRGAAYAGGSSILGAATTATATGSATVGAGPDAGLVNFESTSLTPADRTGAYTNEVAWDGAKGAQRATDYAHGGTYSMKVVSSGSDPWVQLSRQVAMPASGTVSFTRWFRFNAFSANTTAMICALGDATEPTVWYGASFYTNDANDNLDGIGAYGASYTVERIVAASSLTAGSWYRIVTAFNCSTNKYTITIYDSSGTQLGQSADKTPVQSFSNRTAYLVIGRATVSGTTFWFDDLIDGV